MKEQYEAPKSHFMQSGELIDLGMEYCLTGEAVNGDVKYVDDGIISIGEDVMVFKPELQLFGVFDGFGGADGSGRADLASQLAARAVIEYFENTYDEEKDQASMLEAISYARKIVSSNPLAGTTTGLFLHLAKARDSEMRVLFGSAGDCAAGIYPDPVFDGRKFEEVMWFAGDQSDHHGDPTNFIGTSKVQTKRQVQDEAGEKFISRSRKRWLFVSTDGVTGSLGLSDGIDEADIEYTFKYKHDIVGIAQSLLNPPLQRETGRTYDDKSLIVLSF